MMRFTASLAYMPAGGSVQKVLFFFAPLGDKKLFAEMFRSSS